MSMDNLPEIQKKVGGTFQELFGETPLEERLLDITREANEIKRASTIKSIKKELGQLLCSCLAGCEELEVDAAKLIADTIEDIAKRQAQYKSLGRKLKVAILGGAFDPITTGHVRMAKYVLDNAGEFDEVWFTPCFQHLYGKKMTAPDHRLKMVSLACESDGRLRPFSYEIDHQLGGETYHFVKRLMMEAFANEHYNFSYIIGQDNANSFDKWVNFGYLQDAIRFVVVPRKGVEPDPKAKWYRNDFHICMPPSEKDLVEISSTQVREMMIKGSSKASEFLDPKVLTYIYQHGLYQGA